MIIMNVHRELLAASDPTLLCYVIISNQTELKCSCHVSLIMTQKEEMPTISLSVSRGTVAHKSYWSCRLFLRVDRSDFSLCHTAKLIPENKRATGWFTSGEDGLFS